MKTTILNVYGGPGSGKSTSAAYLYYLLKCKGENAELVREYVKEWSWEKRPITAYDEIYFLGKQVRHESLLFGKVKWIVTDAPVYMTAYYANLYCSPVLASGIQQAAQAFYKQAQDDGHEHIHLLLTRSRPYQSEGRYQTESEARDVDRGVKEMLSNLRVPLTPVSPEEDELKRTLDILTGV